MERELPFDPDFDFDATAHDEAPTLREVGQELFEAQNEIIRIQSVCVDELFRLLSMHLSAEDLSALPVIEKINRAAQIRAERGL